MLRIDDSPTGILNIMYELEQIGFFTDFYFDQEDNCLVLVVGKKEEMVKELMPQ